MVETIVLTVAEYEHLLEDSRALNALVGAGVDNWEGYDDAMEALGEGMD